MKKKILFDLATNSRWIGGLYYLKNIIFQLTSNEVITKEYIPLVLCDSEYSEIFEPFENRIILYKYSNRRERIKLVLKSTFECQLIYNYASYKFDFCHFLERKAVFWIPDFQHKYYPGYFTANEIADRDERITRLAATNFPVVVSSNTCLNDFIKFYKADITNKYIIRFVSYIEPEITKLTLKKEKEYLESRNLVGERYAVVMNQFWQHKNHIVVFEAIKKLFCDNPFLNYYFVFTGKMEDYRNPRYISELREKIEDSLVAEHVKILGFIEREEQIAIMKNAGFVIQPSLFEGWGTVVEDAKVLDKTVLLSDIEVHREQKNEKCILFDAHNSKQLADLIICEIGKEHHDNIKKGLQDMHLRAKEYSKNFELLLKENCNEKK